ncbi:DUF4145 domain-containing protein [Rhizobium leguminosarum]|uniref:DUF4145 domain-containing protein n=1 Tax=Rhizobium leguminosarum TaxID=384 RepID=UPI003F97E768
MNRNVWNGYFSEDDFPNFVCPTCGRGNLKLLADTFEKKSPQYLANYRSSPEWDYTMERDQFSAFIKCDVASCGEVSVVAGGTEDIEAYDDEQRIILATLLHPSFIQPAPHIIHVSKNLDLATRTHLLKAFELYWVDLDASANRIRSCVESLLDSLKVPKFNKPARGKKRAKLVLAVRIQRFDSKRPGHKTVLDALRWVGNVGSHEGSIARETLLDGFDLLEFILGELIDNKTANRSALAKRLTEAKGKPKP